MQSVITRGAVGAIALLVTVPASGTAQGDVVVDPDSPAGQEYAIPLEEARRGASSPSGDAGGGGRESAPLFGAGITRAGSSPAGNTAQEASEAGDRGAGSPGDAGSAGDADDGPDGAAGAVAEAVATGDAGSGVPGTIAIAAGVLLTGLAVGFGLRALLRAD